MNGNSEDQFEFMKDSIQDAEGVIEASYCAILHYDENKSQKDIAKELKMSPAKVSRLLNLAREKEIVRFDLNVPRISQLEIGLRRKYEMLKDVCVVGVGRLELEIARRQLGRAAAKYVQRLLEEQDVRHFACGSGRTLFEFAGALETMSRDIEVYSLSSSFPTSHNVFANIIAGIIAAKWRSKCYNWLPEQTSFADIPEDVIEGERRKIRNGLEDSNVTMLMGIGCLDISEGGTLWSMIQAKLVTESELALLKEKEGAVADVNLQIIDDEGAIIDCDINRKSIPVKLAKIRDVACDANRNAKVIGVAGGRKKVQAIRAALRGRLINVLITDDLVAEELLQAE